MDYIKEQLSENTTYLFVYDRYGEMERMYLLENGTVMEHYCEWHIIGTYTANTNTITVTENRRANCRILRKFGYNVK